MDRPLAKSAVTLPDSPPESFTPRYHQHSGDSPKSPGVGRLDPALRERAGDAVAALSPMRRAIQVTGHRRAVPLLPEQAHASPFRLSHPPLVPSEYNRRRLYDSTKNPSGRSSFSFDRRRSWVREG